MSVDLDVGKLLEEDKFRIMTYWLQVLIMLALVKIGSDVWSNGMNITAKWILTFVIVVTFIYLARENSKIGRELWLKSDIRDNIRIQTSIKLELENLEAIRKNKYDIKKTPIEDNIKSLLYKEKEVLERIGLKSTQKSILWKIKRRINLAKERKTKKPKSL